MGRLIIGNSEGGLSVDKSILDSSVNNLESTIFKDASTEYPVVILRAVRYGSGPFNIQVNRISSNVSTATLGILYPNAGNYYLYYGDTIQVSVINYSTTNTPNYHLTGYINNSMIKRTYGEGLLFSGVIKRGNNSRARELILYTYPVGYNTSLPSMNVGSYYLKGEYKYVPLPDKYNIRCITVDSCVTTFISGRAYKKGTFFSKTISGGSGGDLFLVDDKGSIFTSSGPQYVVFGLNNIGFRVGNRQTGYLAVPYGVRNVTIYQRLRS